MKPLFAEVVVRLSFLVLHGALLFLPLSVEVTRKGHHILYAADCLAFVWEHRKFRLTRQSGRHEK
jgi:hypothetical protein